MEMMVKKIVDSLYQVGPIKGSLLSHATYVIVDDFITVINPGSMAFQEETYKLIQSIAPDKRIKRLIITDPSISMTSSIPFFASKEKQLLILTDWRNKERIDSYGLSLRYTIISKNKFVLTLPSKRKLHFIRAPFLSHPGSFLILDKQSKTLFSGELFNMYQAVNHNQPVEIEELVTMYHEMFLPSSDFVKPIVKIIEKMDLQRIITNCGSIYEGDLIKRLTTLTLRHEFYNTDYVVKNIPLINRTYDYIHILNQLLTKLQTHFSKEEIYSVFKDTDIELEKDTCQIKETSLKRRVLYNRFFEIGYEDKGVMWLNLLEPSVNRLARTYYIPKPDLYKLQSIELQDELKQLKEDKLSLLDRSLFLEEELEKTKHSMMRCPITNLYNKKFFEAFLKDHSSEMTAVMEIEIDHIIELNQTYSFEIGNETIQHLHYLIKNDLPQDVLLFRGDGAGFILYFSNYNQEEILQTATMYRNIVEDATTFIEPITVGIGIVFKEDNIDNYIEELDQRVASAHNLGNGQIVYQHIEEDDKTIGSVLLIDDDKYNIGVIKRICEEQQVSFIQCFDIDEALSIIKQREISLIISEINLSKLDAYHLKTTLNDTLSYNTIPFIIVSHNKTRNTLKRANTLNIDYVISKPFYPEELEGIIKKVVKK